MHLGLASAVLGVSPATVFQQNWLKPSVTRGQALLQQQGGCPGKIDF